jgi:hypothetical protein
MQELKAKERPTHHYFAKLEFSRLSMEVGATEQRSNLSDMPWEGLTRYRDLVLNQRKIAPWIGDGAIEDTDEKLSVINEEFIERLTKS